MSEYSRPQKHSLTLNGHRTSVSLEPQFWAAFRHMAQEQNKPLNVLAAEIDVSRGEACGLASAIRLQVLHWYANREHNEEGPEAQE